MIRGSTNYLADYAAGRNTDPWWNGGYQAPAGKITIGRETDGRAYQEHRCTPGSDWNGTQRADCITSNLNDQLREGGEWAVDFEMMLAPNFIAPNPGWSVGGVEIHDVRGAVGLAGPLPAGFEVDPARVITRPFTEDDFADGDPEPDRDMLHSALRAASAVGTQANLSLLPSQNGLQPRIFGGDISTSSGAPVNAADRVFGPQFPFQRGVYHRVTLYVKCSADRAKGHVRLAIDGQVVFDQACATIYTASSGYIKQPFYRDPNQATNPDTFIRYGDEDSYVGATAWDEAFGTSPVNPLGLTGPTRRANGEWWLDWTPQTSPVPFGYRLQRGTRWISSSWDGTKHDWKVAGVGPQPAGPFRVVTLGIDLEATTG